jgi:hypothetical protein
MQIISCWILDFFLFDREDGGSTPLRNVNAHQLYTRHELRQGIDMRSHR